MIIRVPLMVADLIELVPLKRKISLAKLVPNKFVTANHYPFNTQHSTLSTQH